MSPRITLATTRRVLQQLRHDPRTLALLFIVPVVLLGLLAWVFSATPEVFDAVGAPLLAVFPFIMMFIVTSITTQRERATGTLERLLVMPAGKLDILLGYAISFGIIATLQALLASLFAVHVYGLDIAGPAWSLILVALADALLGTALGLFASAFASSEFQAVQFMPAFVLPQFLLCGLLVPVDKLPDILHAVAQVLPLTFAVDAMQFVSRHASLSGEFFKDIGVVLTYAALAILLGAATLRRQTK